MISYKQPNLNFSFITGTTIQFDAKAAPLPVEDTPEVVAARAAHLK